MEEDLLELWEVHCKGKYPREFGAKSGKFTRNHGVINVKALYNFVSMWDFRDTYVSVYSFEKWHEASEIRKLTARIDTLFIDIDHEEDPKIAFREAKKLVEYLIERKNVIPRVYFSGAKGFHVFIDFPEVDLFFKQDSIRFAVSRLASKLGLKCIDYQVVELARLSRLPLTVNSKTGYKCTPIDPVKFLKLDYDSIIHFCKRNYNKIEVHESKDFADLMRRIDILLITQSATLEAKRKKSEPVQLKKGNGNWRRRRIEYYAKVLREKGYLSLDPLIVKIHSRNPHVQKYDNPGVIEHIARVHLVLLCIEEGLSDEEIHEIFKHAKDYNREKTQYYIEYNRRWLKGKKQLEEKPIFK